MGLNHSPHPIQQRYYTTFSGTRIGNSKSWLKPQRSTAPRRDYRDRQCVLPISSPAHTPLPAAEVDKRAYRRLLHREGNATGKCLVTSTSRKSPSRRSASQASSPETRPAASRRTSPSCRAGTGVDSRSATRLLPQISRQSAQCPLIVQVHGKPEHLRWWLQMPIEW